MEAGMDQVSTYIAIYGLKVLGAIIILILGRIAAGIGRGIVKRILEKAKTDPSIVSFVSGFTYVLSSSLLYWQPWQSSASRQHLLLRSWVLQVLP